MFDSACSASTLACAADCFGERASLGLTREALLVRVHQFDAALVDHTGEIRDQDVFERQAEIDQQVQTGERRGARARGD